MGPVKVLWDGDGVPSMSLLAIIFRSVSFHIFKHYEIQSWEIIKVITRNQLSLQNDSTSSLSD